MNPHHFYENFTVLKKSIIWAIIFFFISVLVSFFVTGSLLSYFILPLEKLIKNKNIQLIYNNLMSPFLIKMNFSILIGFFVSVPFFVFQVYHFISPGLYKKEKKLILPYIFMSPLLFLTGASLAYFLIIPNAVNFFISFDSSSTQKINMMVNLMDYLNFCIKIIILFGLSFQFPLILNLLVRIGIFTYAGLKKSRRFVIVAIFIIAAVLTPPDILSQIALALPLIGLYEIIVFINKKKIKDKKAIL